MTPNEWYPTRVGTAWLMINGGDDRYQILAATLLNIDPILVLPRALNIGQHIG
jgi:ABC-type transport system involved in Fe-S cluster assembly fused permease/ATPase subunit